MSFGARLAVQAGHRNDLDRHPLALRLELDGVERLAGVLGVGDVDLLDVSTTGLEEFEHGVSTFDLLAPETFLLAGARRTSRPPTCPPVMGRPPWRDERPGGPFEGRDGDSRRLFQEYDRARADAFDAAEGTETFGGRRLHRDERAHDRGEFIGHLRA